MRTPLNKRFGLGCAALLAVVLMGLGALRTGESPANFIVHKQARPVLELRFTDAGGRARSLADFRGKLVLLNVWATWCAPCRSEMPTLDRLQAALGGPDFEVVALSSDRAGLPRHKELTMTSSQHPQTLAPLGRDAPVDTGSRFGRWRMWIVLTVATLTTGLAFNWSWLIALGIAPIIVKLLPCAAMCALGLCMNRMSDHSLWTEEAKGSALAAEAQAASTVANLAEPSPTVTATLVGSDRPLKDPWSAPKPRRIRHAQA